MPTKRTKTATILERLRRPRGASMAELRKAVGWQDHSIRAALTGLRKKGHEVIREKTDAGGTRYRVSAEDRS